jgi:hypothetical protein
MWSAMAMKDNVGPPTDSRLGGRGGFHRDGTPDAGQRQLRLSLDL